MKLRIKSKRFTAVALTFVFLVTSLSVYLGVESQSKSGDDPLVFKDYTNEKERKNAEEISDMTGVSTNEILLMRKNGSGWNNIMDELKNNPSHKTEITDDELDIKLKEEGFSKEDISQAKMLVERVSFAFNEIKRSADSTNDIINPTVKTNNTDSNAEDDKSYSELADKFNKNTAIYLSLKLKDEFMSIESALDQYLYCLQVEVDLLLYITDKEEYDKQMNEKSVLLIKEKAITTSKLEEKMLEYLQNNATTKSELNNKEKDNKYLPNDKNEKRTLSDEENVLNGKIPQVPDPRPVNPNKAAQDELNTLKSKNSFR